MKNNNAVFRTALSIIMVTLFSLSASMVDAKKKKPSADKPKKASSNLTIEGEIIAVFGEDDSLVGVEVLTFKGAIYNLTFNAKAKKLAKELNGMDAAVTGTIDKKRSKKGEQWLTVSSYKEILLPDDDYAQE